MKRGGGQVRLKPPNNFENNGATSQALIRCTVLYCFKKNCPPPPNQQLLPTALDNIMMISWLQKILRCQCFIGKPVFQGKFYGLLSLHHWLDYSKAPHLRNHFFQPCPEMLFIS